MRNKDCGGGFIVPLAVRNTACSLVLLLLVRAQVVFLVCGTLLTRAPMHPSYYRTQLMQDGSQM